MNKRFRQFLLWCVPLTGVGLFSLVALLPFKPGRTSVPNARLEEWRFYPEASQLEITLSAASQPRYFYLAQPPRIIVDVPNTNLGYVPTKQNYSGAIQSVRVSQLKAGVARIVMDLAPGTVLNPNSVQLQPVSTENPTRWVLRPLLGGESSYLPPGFSPQTNYLPPVNTAPQPPSNLPPGLYNPQQLPGNLPQSVYNPPLPGNAPQSVYNPPLPSNIPQRVYNPQQIPGNLPQDVYNPPPPPGINVPVQTGLPQNTYNSSPQVPFVRVPPLTPDNPSQLPGSILPPPTFPNQSGNLSIPPVISPDYPAPNLPNDQPPNYPNSR